MHTHLRACDFAEALLEDVRSRWRDVPAKPYQDLPLHLDKRGCNTVRACRALKLTTVRHGLANGAPHGAHM
eukprot:5860868-Pleurochrysis_carterae.AAC.1